MDSWFFALSWLMKFMFYYRFWGVGNRDICFIVFHYNQVLLYAITVVLLYCGTLVPKGTQIFSKGQPGPSNKPCNSHVRGPCSGWQLGQWYLSISVDWCSSMPTQLHKTNNTTFTERFAATYQVSANHCYLQVKLLNLHSNSM